jgi:hypothetical protein
MSINRTKSWLLAWVLSLMFSSLAHGQIVERRFSQATGQPIANVEPESDYLPQIDDYQLFDQADLSTYGSGVQPNEGIFFKYEFIDWTISAPRRVPVGDSRVGTFIVPPIPVPPAQIVTINKFSSADNSFIEPIWQNGNRVEAGWVEDRRGWLLSAFKIQNYDTNIFHTREDVVFLNTSNQNPGLMGLTLADTRLQDKQNLWGAEVMRLYRMPVGPKGGQFEFMAGPRYFRFNDDFLGFSKVNPMTNNFAWETITQNQLIGAQFGFRFNKRLGRFTFISENRFMAAANVQSLSIDGRHGALNNPLSGVNPPLQIPANSFNSSIGGVQFSPLAELRLDVNYQVFRSVSLTAGWTGIFVGGIARSTERTVYTLPSMSLSPTLPRGDVFINGVNVGVVVNR